MREQSAFSRELVKVRRRGRGVTIAAQLRTDIFTADPDNVRTFGG